MDKALVQALHVRGTDVMTALDAGMMECQDEHPMGHDVGGARSKGVTDFGIWISHGGFCVGLLMDKAELEQRTKAFALRVIRFVSAWPKGKVADVLSYQLLRSATSIGANYREANRAESRNGFIPKIALVEKEAAETQYWLELS